jgi:hypothetical protein
MSRFDFAIFQDGRQILKIVAKSETIFYLIWDFRRKLGYFC